MKEFLEALSNRVRSPLFGYFVLAFIIINWKALLLLWLADVDIETRIEYFCFYTNYLSLLFYPLLASVISAVAYPWVNLYFLRLANKPALHKNSLQIKTDHERLMQQAKLEALRNEMFAKKEEGLIEQAKRDQEVKNIEDTNLREKLENEIESLRKERDDLRSSNNATPKTTKKKPNNPRYVEFKQYLDSGKLSDFIAESKKILTGGSYDPSEVHGSDYAKAFGLLDQKGYHVELNDKGRAFFEWLILQEDEKPNK